MPRENYRAFKSRSQKPQCQLKSVAFCLCPNVTPSMSLCYSVTHKTGQRANHLRPKNVTSSILAQKQGFAKAISLAIRNQLKLPRCRRRNAKKTLTISKISLKNFKKYLTSTSQGFMFRPYLVLPTLIFQLKSKYHESHSYKRKFVKNSYRCGFLFALPASSAAGLERCRPRALPASSAAAGFRAPASEHCVF